MSLIFISCVYIIQKIFSKVKCGREPQSARKETNTRFEAAFPQKKNFILKSNPTYFVRANPPEQVAAHYHILYLSLLAPIQLLLQIAYHRSSFHSIRSFHLKSIFSPLSQTIELGSMRYFNQ